jgi:C4-dicarboxylate-specific signal transduction histidine kinase
MYVARAGDRLPDTPALRFGAGERIQGVTPTEPRGTDKDAHELQGRLMHVSRLATIGEMAAGVAHELNQPLTAITTYAQACTRLLDRVEPNLGDVREALQQIASQAVRAGAIIRRLRNLVRHTDSERRPGDINALVEEMRELMETDARVHGVRLRFELAQGLPRVMVDGVQIQHVLLNLLRNALEALATVEPGRREIVISTSLTREGEIELALADSGPGVEPAVAERMFDPFFTTKEFGTGLGLTISATILRIHGGTLGYRPASPAGACFFARLPTA